jgi:formylglycine-generating enzyme required for sulfatase activity
MSSRPAHPLWDGKETVSEYAARAGIKDVELALNLDGNVAMRLVLIPAGKCLLGSPEGEPNRYPDEGPRREVTITRPFYLGAFEVKQGEYQAVMKANPSRSSGAARPVEQVGWADAVAFCQALARKTGRTCRLSTETEWEHACRAGSTARYAFGDDANSLLDHAWFLANSDGRTHPVGQKKPNPWGLHDVHGNVWEWCSDWYADSYAGAARADPQGAPSGTRRVLRGGSLADDASLCRSAYRNTYTPEVQLYGIGFRVVVEVDPAGAPAPKPGPR